ncbi:PLP-dependent transferase [Periconia macrospinosa]|uniref:PLP-dependent transferase n=1 Tax=Periconia macrospinosa TaxID=97972 RepID=A0A2V1E5Y5_9PLEO|nr:PLP-dependent transferase [Periconia macrospinosa]
MGIIDQNDHVQRIRYNSMVHRMRKHEYPMIKGITYLDYGGTQLPSKSLTRSFSKQLQKYLISNTHSALSSKSTSPQAIVDTARQDVLALFGASPEHFEVVFTANATAGVKLVAEALSGHKEGFSYFYHRDCHTSLVGVRELASTSHCLASDEETETWLDQPTATEPQNHPTLFAYPAQSNMNGRRLPLEWSSRMRSSPSHKNTYTLLDIAALASTTRIDLSDPSTAPDFLALSFYKIYGYPDLGALIVRKSAARLFEQRRYFGGGTTASIACGDGNDAWVVRKEKSLSARLEDGTLPTHNILALKCAIRVHQQLYGGLEQISQHVSWLTHILHDKLNSLRHENGQLVCRIYTDPASDYTDPKTQGGVVALNIMDPFGTCYSSGLVGEHALKSNIHLRAGGLCNPAGMAQALGYTAADLRYARDAGYVCGVDLEPMGRPFGMVRVSLGASSTLSDVETFVRFVKWGFTELECGKGWREGKLVGLRGVREEMRGEVQRVRQEFYERGSEGGTSSSEDFEGGKWVGKGLGLGVVRMWALVMRR